jgi:transposase-like protein
MARYSLTILYLLTFQCYLLGQISKYNQLIDTVTKYAGLFVSIHPPGIAKLSMNDTTSYIETLNESSQHTLDSKILLEIIQNSKHPDTTIWTDVEIKNSILLKNRDDLVSLNQVARKFNLVDKKQIKFYRKQINEFNNLSSSDKNIFYLSRPVFDNSKKYAVVYFDNGHGGLGGGGRIILLSFHNDTWRQIGNIARWRY